MYNDRMPISSYEIRVCTSCGLRYPLVERHPFGTRCPVCMGDTRVILERHLDTESHVTDQRKDERGNKLAVLLDNVRSAWNVGSILRSADGFGFTHAYLCGITPAADREAVTKTSLGAENSVPWTYHKDAVGLVKGLKVEGWRVYALEEDERALDIKDLQSMISADQPMVLIVGNEVTGVDPELLDLCDQIFYIPMRGEKRSLNVTIAFGVAAFALRSQKVKQ
jgi:23S rRNA (guanosine2251-2'-O)-methyltransferase